MANEQLLYRYAGQSAKKVRMPEKNKRDSTGMTKKGYRAMQAVIFVHSSMNFGHSQSGSAASESPKVACGFFPTGDVEKS